MRANSIGHIVSALFGGLLGLSACTTAPAQSSGQDLVQINFDARIDNDGNVWLIECNPRFYFNMDVAMVAGLNFADLANSSGRSIEDQTIRIPQALLRDLLKLELPTSSDLKMLGHWLRDPLMFALVALGYQRKWRAPWFEKVIAGHKSAA